MDDRQIAESFEACVNAIGELGAQSGVIFLALDALVRTHPDPEAFARHLEGSLLSTQLQGLGMPHGPLPAGAHSVATRLLARARGGGDPNPPMPSPPDSRA